MEFLIDFKFVFINLFFLIIWFDTDAFIEYVKYIPWIRDIFKIKEYLDFRNLNDISYPNFLVIRYNNFFTKLISCPKCLNFWISLIFINLYYSIFSLFFVYFVSVLLYNIYIKVEKHG